MMHRYADSMPCSAMYPEGSLFLGLLLRPETLFHLWQDKVHDGREVTAEPGSACGPS